MTATSASPVGATWAASVGRSGPFLYASGAPDAAMDAQALISMGGSQPHSNQWPYLALSSIIGLRGIYPSRS